MDKHPIESIMTGTMENIRDMIDVNTVVGKPIQTADGSTVIPVSKVSFGFVSGGGEYGSKRQTQDGSLPFGGGTGAGVTVQPVGFLVSSCGHVSLLPARQDGPAERLIAMAPQVLSMLREAVGKKCCEKDVPPQDAPFSETRPACEYPFAENSPAQDTPSSESRPACDLNVEPPAEPAATH